ncbi:MAG: cyanophycinase [Pseudoxanthomonas sp.]
MRRAPFRPLLALLLALPAWWAGAQELEPGGERHDGYVRYLIGDPAAPTPGKVSPGLLLLGGGDRNHGALRWFLDHAGHGHLVVLSASYGRQIADEFDHDAGGVASAQTLVFGDRKAAYDPAVLAALAHADAIFIAGGDQARYVRLWKDTPLAQALDAHVRAGKPLGGTSAGLAMLGQYLYGALDGGSQTSGPALADPLGPANTLVTGFLHLDLLAGIITDTHFSERQRLGRLVAFLAKAESIAGHPLTGLGVDEAAALAVEGDGSARVYATDPRRGAIVVRGGLAPQQPGRPMRLARLQTVGVGVGSRLQLPQATVERPAFERAYRVEDGVLLPLDPPRQAAAGGYHPVH